MDLRKRALATKTEEEIEGGKKGGRWRMDREGVGGRKE